MRHRYLTLSILAILSFGTILSGCYGYDPIKEKQNQNQEQNDTNEDISPSAPDGQSVFDVHFSFQKWSDTTPTLPVGEGGFPSDFWASASNEGFNAIPSHDLPYPVTLEENGYKGHCVRMLSRPGKKVFGFGSYLVAASLFSGSIDVSKLISSPLEATHFGREVRHRPLRMRGYYRYKGGPQLIDGSGSVITELEGKDQCTIAGVFYEVPEDKTYLTGKNLYTDEAVISIARMITGDTDGWQPFDLTFKTVNPKPLDFKNKRYRLALLFASSSRGDEYIGAINSELFIDEVVLTLTSLPE